MSKVVVALDDNALEESPKEQLEFVKGTVKSLVGLIRKGYEVVISHGNGPQVGSISLGLNHAAGHEQGPPFPFLECGAMSQAYISCQMQESLLNKLHTLGIRKEAVTLVTQVEVASDDPTFQSPAKPIRLLYTKEQAEKTKKGKGYTFVENAGHGYRRVVPFPQPINIAELDSIEALTKHDTPVIATGGGGIPVVKEQDRYRGVDAVVDKDKTNALPAAHSQSDRLIVLTVVDYVYINYGKDDRKGLGGVTIDDMEGYIADNQFTKGGMLPEIEATLQFIEGNPKGNVLITSSSGLSNALEGEIGTRITLWSWMRMTLKSSSSLMAIIYNNPI